MASPVYRDGPEFEAPIIELEEKIDELKSFSQSTQVDLSDQINKLVARCEERKRAIFSRLTPWQKVQTARHPRRPLTSDYIQMLIDDFVELYGDRAFRDDPAVVTGFGWFEGRRICIVGQRKGKSTEDKRACNFGCPHPEGYRKALLKMQLADKFGIPILSFINTPGAYPGVGAEERGQAFVIARNLMEMSNLRVPVIAVVIGEGGSGGALGIGVANRVVMLEHSYYSVISPEGCAAILWKSSEYKEKAAEILKLTGQDLLGFGVVDEVIPEPLGGAHRDHVASGKSLRKSVLRHLSELEGLTGEQLVATRAEKLKSMGVFLENQVTAPVAEADA